MGQVRGRAGGGARTSSVVSGINVLCPLSLLRRDAQSHTQHLAAFKGPVSSADPGAEAGRAVRCRLDVGMAQAGRQQRRPRRGMGHAAGPQQGRCRQVRKSLPGRVRRGTARASRPPPSKSPWFTPVSQMKQRRSRTIDRDRRATPGATGGSGAFTHRKRLPQVPPPQPSVSVRARPRARGYHSTALGRRKLQ